MKYQPFRVLNLNTAGLIWGATYDTLANNLKSHPKFPDGWLMALFYKETSAEAYEFLYKVVRSKIIHQDTHIKRLIEEELIK